MSPSESSDPRELLAAYLTALPACASPKEVVAAWDAFRTSAYPKLHPEDAVSALGDLLDKSPYYLFRNDVPRLRHVDVLACMAKALRSARRDAEFVEALEQARWRAFDASSVPASIRRTLEELAEVGRSARRKGRPPSRVPTLEEARRLAGVQGFERDVATLVGSLKTGFTHGVLVVPAVDEAAGFACLGVGKRAYVALAEFFRVPDGPSGHSVAVRELDTQLRSTGTKSSFKNARRAAIAEANKLLRRGNLGEIGRPRDDLLRLKTSRPLRLRVLDRTRKPSN